MPFSSQSSASARGNVFDVEAAPKPAALDSAAQGASIFDVAPSCGRRREWWRVGLRALRVRLGWSQLQRGFAAGAVGLVSAVAVGIAAGVGNSEPRAERLEQLPALPSPQRHGAAARPPRFDAAAVTVTRREHGAGRARPAARRARRQRAGRGRLPKPAAAAPVPVVPRVPERLASSPALVAPAPAAPAPVVRPASERPAPLPVAAGAPPEFM